MELFKTNGVCARGIELEVKDGIIENVNFLGGCDGNTKGLSSLLKGMKVEDVKTKLRGITCRTKGTSCPDQLAQILEKNF